MVQPGVLALGKKKRTTFLPRNWASETGFPFSSGKVKSGALVLMLGMKYLYKNCPALANRSRERGPRVWSLLQRTVASAIGVILLLTFGSAQVLKRPHEDTPPPDQNESKINAKKAKHYPRAIAVIEFLPGGGARLVPVALRIDDRYYDASLYGANPEPIAVEPETVYEATNYGEPAGFFTVTTPEELKGNWIASGDWKPRRALDEKVAQQAAKQPKAKADNPDDDRPTLRRPGSSASSSASGSNSGASSSGSSSSNGTSSASTNSANSTSSSTPATAENDPNRPTLKKPSQSANDSSPAGSASSSQGQVASARAPSGSNEASDESDPNRPLLRRGKSEPAASAPQPASLPAPGAPAAATADPGKPAADGPTIGRKSFAAVSDAGAYETRSLLYAMNDNERSSKSEQMSAMALEEIRKFVATRHTPPLPKDAALTDYDLRGYDLEFSNSPTLVFTAKLPVPGAKAFRGPEFDYFVTFVARVDYNNAPIKIFCSVTDSNHLDAFPRMEIIDAVDADANGRGDLLFRQYSDTGISYSLYRVFPYDLQKVFEGGSGA